MPGEEGQETEKHNVIDNRGLHKLLFVCEPRLFFLEIIVIFSNQLNALWGTFVFYLSVYKLNNTVKIYTNTETELNFVFTVYYYIDDTILKCIK